MQDRAAADSKGAQEQGLFVLAMPFSSLQGGPWVYCMRGGAHGAKVRRRRWRSFPTRLTFSSNHVKSRQPGLAIKLVGIVRLSEHAHKYYAPKLRASET
jgi:hypothetical protein